MFEMFSQNLPGKTNTLKQERKLPVKRQISVKLISKRTQNTSQSITSRLALPLYNYEEPMKKAVATETDNSV